MAEETRWVWNKGIAALCDHRLPDDFPQGLYSYHGDSSSRSETGFYQSLAEHVSPGDLVWVKVSWLPFFVSNILPDINESFVLVTGDLDTSLPSGMPGESEAILASQWLIHWYAQNYDGTSTEKISPIPVGMDFHTIHQHDNWGIKKLPVSRQNDVLEMIRLKLEPMERRKPRLYIDTQFAGRREEKCAGAINDLSREELFKQISTDPAVFLQQRFLPQFEMWLQRGQFTYVLSHYGVGLDCHRNWEALVLGHVLVVQKSSLDSLYEDLPVIIVDDWRMIKPQSIGDLLHINHDKKYRYEKLTSRYWVNEMRSRAMQTL